MCSNVTIVFPPQVQNTVFQTQDKCFLDWLVSAAAVGEANMRDGATLDQNNNGAQDKYQGQSERCETQMTKEAGNHLRPSCMSSFSMRTVHEWWPNSILAGRLFRWLEESCDDDITGVWFKHDKPTSIEISAKEIKMQVIRGGILHADLCSALIRLYQQLDAKMNTNPCGQRYI